jgi:MarR family transcriptional regulator, transcriptional regulator for hemolysin
MATTAPAPGTDLLLQLSQAGHALATELTAGLAGIGITPREHCVLATAMTGEMTQIRLAELCALDKTTMVATIDELERAGLAERRPSSADRRVRIIGVTPAGEQLVAEGRRIIDAVFDDVLDALPSDEREPFVAGLGRLVDGRLSRRVECAKPPRRPRERKLDP